MIASPLFLLFPDCFVGAGEVSVTSGHCGVIWLGTAKPSSVEWAARREVMYRTPEASN